MTVTDGSKSGTMSVAELSAAWDDLAKLLRAGGPAPPRPPRGSGKEKQAAWRRRSKARTSYLSEYALVLELGTQGQQRLHAHIIFTGRFIPQRLLSRWARRCGFGRIADIREIDTSNAEEVARYAAKLAYYGAKAGEAVAMLKRRSRSRLRPLRTSRGWYPGGLRRVEEELGIRKSGGSNDPGPWVLIQRHPRRARYVARLL